MRTRKSAPSPSSTGDQPVAAASVQPPPPQSNGATRQLKRMPLRRMPTEMIMTTRFKRVRPEAELESAVRPVAEVVAEHVPQPFDRLPTAPVPAAMSGGQRRALPTDEFDLLPEFLDHVMELTPAPVMTQPYAATSRPTPPMPAFVPAPMPMPQPLPQPFPQPIPQPSAAPARPHPSAAREIPMPAAVRRRLATPSSSRVPLPHGGPYHDELTQARRQLAQAVENARKSEQRARDAELMAAWAERYVPQQPHDSGPHYFEDDRRVRKVRWVKRVLQISLIGLAVGGYVSLLGPVRERVIAQNATIQRLTELEEQLRNEQLELRERFEQERAPAPVVEPPPPAARATPGRAVARR